MHRALELVSRLPEAVLFSTDLWNVAKSAFSVNLMSLVMKEFSQIKEVFPEHIQMIDSVVNMQDSATPLCNAILQNIYAYRYLINEKLYGQVNIFVISVLRHKRIISLSLSMRSWMFYGISTFISLKM